MTNDMATPTTADLWGNTDAAYGGGDLLTIKEASAWASEHLKKNVTCSNISYLIQYGKVAKLRANGATAVSKSDLLGYYKSLNGKREVNWREKLGDDLNWALSFDNLKEKDTTKHVHRLHPYKGKFIPQLVEYFLDAHTDEFKKTARFKPGDIVLDPFSGSGTTMVQCNELGIHAIGIDVSAFNALMANVKVSKVDFQDLAGEIRRITDALRRHTAKSAAIAFENELLDELNNFNKRFFPSPDYKIKVGRGEINEDEYGQAKARAFEATFDRLQKKYGLTIAQDASDTFLQKWYLAPVMDEIDFTFGQLRAVKNSATKKILTIILSRTIRTCRATTHADLATLKEPVTKTYYCAKHGKICKPLFSILSWWERYAKDATHRLYEFDALRTNTRQVCFQGDSRDINIFDALRRKAPEFAAAAKRQKIRGIFSSPPYVGLIDYHEQHAYAYDLFGFKRHDELEIAPLFKGQGKMARESYITAIAQALNNAKRHLQDDYDVFLVANDKYNLYPAIAAQSGMRIVSQHKRPVLNRSEKDKTAYAEAIFHLKEN